MLQELQDFEAVYGESNELREVFESPAVTLPQKMKVLEAIAQRLGESPLTLTFLRVLLANYRMPLLEEAVQAYGKIAQRPNGSSASCRSLRPRTSREQSARALAARFRELTRKQVELEFRIDSELLGGILAQIGSTVYDGSVRGDLARIRQAIDGAVTGCEPVER